MATRRVFIPAFIFAAAIPIAAHAETAPTITAYVIKTQEERDKTRWTLTEWLRIKERMKLMDLWLAMFSDPKKDTFRPELAVSYSVLQGDLRLTDKAGMEEKGSLPSSVWKAQLWLTNVISGTVGIRTLNLDLGVEGAMRRTGEFQPKLAEGATSSATDEKRQASRQYGAVALRLFGKSIQDSSLVLKYGQYTMENTLLSRGGLDEATAVTGKGLMAGAELQLYLFRFLGAEGTYQRFGSASRYDDTRGSYGSYYEAMGFVEVSLLRLMVGHYDEDWHLWRPEDERRFRVHDKGWMAGVRLQI